MLVYRDGGRRVDCRGELSRLRRNAAHASRSRDAALSLLIQLAEFESAVADATAPERDRVDPRSQALREATESAADAWLRASDFTKLATHLAAVATMPLPSSIELRVSEGYAYYALFPESYATSAERFAAVTGAQRVHAIGIRSIGASLSAVVAAALRRAGRTVTTSLVRPHGHPFDRRLYVDDSLANVFRGEAAQGACFAIVDEGPGLSGSSFASVATHLRSLDVPAERIVFFPSWTPDPRTLRSESARRAWSEHSQYCVSDRSLTPEKVFSIDDDTVDFSAGRWRDSVLAGDLPAVHPQHERWKVFVPRAGRLIRFAGLGPYGEASVTRAEALADLGIALRPGEARSGFLDLPFVTGTPLSRCDTTEDAAAIGTYIARVAGAFPVREPADATILQRMIETNLRDVIPRMRIDPPDSLPAAALDGRMLPHEWIRTPRGLAKVDALDHHAGHFLPGPQSPAWDLAGAAMEMGMNEPQSEAMLRAFERESGDRSLRASLPFHELAYAAFRFGYATLSSQTLAGTDDGVRFARAAEFYSQCALKAAACFTASAKSPRKQIARSSMNT